ncbi:hypothetical protein Bmyc01_39260 [Bacillus mycoides]|nr:hypothetical protein Bmyc01_39260 [Bacillus mycoides]
MSKFTLEDKMNAAIHYQDGIESIKDIEKSLGANCDGKTFSIGGKTKSS